MTFQDRTNTGFELTANFFMKEIRKLSEITTSAGFQGLLDKLEQYQGFLKSVRKTTNPALAITGAAGGQRIFYADTSSEFVKDALSVAHLAACCEMMNGSRIPRHELRPDTLEILAGNYLKQLQTAPPVVIRNTHNRFHTMDAVRTMHLLRALGLITRVSGNFAQLALGSGSGYKDIYSLHKMPALLADHDHGSPVYTFTIEQEAVGHVVISDPDSQHSEYFNKLNRESGSRVVALNKGADEAMIEFCKSGLKKRNLVTMLRLDHQMIADTDTFIEKLSPCIDEKCDLIMTIGSGNSFDAFNERIRIMEKMFCTLDHRGLHPVLVKLHNPGDLTEQIQSLQYGNAKTSTYQVLYCKLLKGAL